MAAAALVMLEGFFLSSQTPQPIRLPRSSSLPSLPCASLPSLPYPAWDLPTSSEPRENSVPKRNDRGPAAAHARMIGNAIPCGVGRLELVFLNL